jgi:hypothetical protein
MSMLEYTSTITSDFLFNVSAVDITLDVLWIEYEYFTYEN